MDMDYARRCRALARYAPRDIADQLMALAERWELVQQREQAVSLLKAQLASRRSVRRNSVDIDDGE